MQDESKKLNNGGGFTAFIPWSFKPDNTVLERRFPRRVGPVPYLRILAASRLYLDNFDHVGASWVTQGPDIGDQYRSVVFFYDPQQEAAAKKAKQLLEQAKVFRSPIVTQIIPAGQYYLAEDYHQKYLEKNPGGYCSHILHSESPKIREVLKPLVPAGT